MLRQFFLVLSAVVLTVVGVVCTGGDGIGVDDTEVRVNNRLLSIPVGIGADRDTIDSVHVHGLQVGDVSFGALKAGVVSTYKATDSYGTSVSLSVDSAEIVIVYCGTFGCAPVRKYVRTIVPVNISLDRNERNTVTLDTSIIRITDYFGATRLRVDNRLINVPVLDSTTTVTFDSLHVYGARFNDTAAVFSSIAAGVLTAYDTLASVTDSVSMRIDSVVGIYRVFSQRNVIVWDSIPSLNVAVEKFQANTLVLDGGSRLLRNLGPATVR